MAKKQPKRWVYSPKKEKVTVPDAVNLEIKQKADELVESFLKPQYVQERDDEAQFNHIVDIYTKWWRNNLYFCSTYYYPGPTAISPEFESKFARLEYVGEQRFNLSFMRYTEQWVEIYTDLTLEQCLESVKNDPFFHP